MKEPILYSCNFLTFRKDQTMEKVRRLVVVKGGSRGKGRDEQGEHRSEIFWSALCYWEDVIMPLCRPTECTAPRANLTVNYDTG